MSRGFWLLEIYRFGMAGVGQVINNPRITHLSKAYVKSVCRNILTASGRKVFFPEAYRTNMESIIAKL
jgi:hypothetical protein